MAGSNMMHVLRSAILLTHDCYCLVLLQDYLSEKNDNDTIDTHDFSCGAISFGHR